MFVLSYTFLMALLSSSLMGQDYYDGINGDLEKRSSSNYYFPNEEGNFKHYSRATKV
jgi:hypothetical protein